MIVPDPAFPSWIWDFKVGGGNPECKISIRIKPPKFTRLNTFFLYGIVVVTRVGFFCFVKDFGALFTCLVDLIYSCLFPFFLT